MPPTRIESRFSRMALLSGSVVVCSLSVLVAARLCGLHAGNWPPLALAALLALAAAGLGAWRRSGRWLSVASLATGAAGWALHNGVIAPHDGVALISLMVARAAFVLLAIVLVLSLVPRVAPAKILAAGGSVALTLILFDLAALARRPPPNAPRQNEAVFFTGENWSEIKHPTMGRVMQPWGWMKTYYVDNPRGYFEVERAGTALDMRTWRVMPRDADVEVFLAERCDGTLGISFPTLKPGGAPPTLEHRFFPLLPAQKCKLRYAARADGPQRIELVCMLSQGKTAAPPGTWQTDLSGRWTEVEHEFVIPAGVDMGALIFTVFEPGAYFELRDVHIITPRAVSADEPSERYGVAYNMNGEGFRDRPWKLEAAPHTKRIAFLGDSYTAGEGVHARDLVTVRLEENLNRAKVAARFEVMNFGVIGFSTRQERACFECCVAKYKPAIVVVMMFDNDPISGEELIAMNSTYIWEKTQTALGLEQAEFMRQWKEIEARMQDYDRCIPDLNGLAEGCRQIGARLLIAYWHFSELPQCDRMIETVDRAMKGTDVATLDLYPALRRDHTTEELVVHRLDGHMNEIAHGIAAAEIERYLRELGWIGPEKLEDQSALRSGR